MLPPSPTGDKRDRVGHRFEETETQVPETTLSDEFLTTKKVAELYGLPEGTLRYYRQLGIGPASFKLTGKRVVYRRSEVDRWVAEQEATSGRGGVR